TSWNALVDLEACKTADEDPVRTEPRHSRCERVVWSEERATEAGAELGERFGICSAHADIDLFGTKAEVKQDGAASFRSQRLVGWAALGHHRTAVHGGARRRQTQRQHMAPAVISMTWQLIGKAADVLGRADAQGTPRRHDLQRSSGVDAGRLLAGAM